MFDKLEELQEQNEISKNDILNIIKDEARHLTIYDEMTASSYLQDEGKYIQKSYRDEYLDVTIKYFLKRLHRIKNDNKDYPETVDKKRLRGSLKILKNQNLRQKEKLPESNKTPLMYGIISIYTTFILGESIHPLNTPFPADEKIILKDGTYYCPVKHNQSKNPDALCRLCIAKEMEDLPN